MDLFISDAIYMSELGHWVMSYENQGKQRDGERERETIREKQMEM